jgi:hypothetical protein
MKSDSFKSDEVWATGNSSRNSGRPGRVVSDHKTVTPEAVEYCAVDKSRLVDLEPFKSVRVDAGTGCPRALSHVNKHWAIGVGPRVPVSCDLLPGSDRCGQLES